MKTIANLALAALLMATTGAALAPAQTWDTSGNGLLKGTYYFRQVIWLIDTSGTGTLGRALSAYGNINFDGSGHYTISNSAVLDTNVGQPQTLTTSGTYSISASGFGFMSHPLSSADSIYGLVANGIFVGSATESNTNDLFIAAPLASPAPTASSFRGTYSFVQFDSPTGSPVNTQDLQFQMSPDGSGNIPAFRISGRLAGGTLTQSVPAIKYVFSNGGANVHFGATTANTLVVGDEYLYFSPDGNFVFGGSPLGWDMMVGVKTGGAAPVFSGLYYNAGMYQDNSQLGAGFADLESFYGSLKASSGTLLGHQRLLSPFKNNPLDFTYTSTYTLNADGSYDDGLNHYIFGPGGTIRLGVGNNTPTIGIDVAVQAPALTPTGVFIDPTGVVNAASSAMFTSGIAPGELITLYGSNLSQSTLADGTFPFTLGGVQVTVNDRPAPIYVVSPGQISAIVPFGTTENIASIKVVNNQTASNIVTTFVNTTAPGAFTVPPGGIGSAAALHADFTLVSAAKPAQIGETILLFVTGLGAVSPAVADGTPGPSNPLSGATSAINIYIGGVKATTSFIGLAPQLVGLYQINVVVPTGVTSGKAALDIAGPDFYTTQATIPIQ